MHAHANKLHPSLFFIYMENFILDHDILHLRQPCLRSTVKVPLRKCISFMSFGNIRLIYKAFQV